MERLRRYLLLSCLLSSLFSVSCCSSSVQFWNASSTNVSLPNNFIIDEDNQVLVIAANNSVCHLSFDLTVFSNVLDVVPNAEDTFQCRYLDARNEEKCQNYHHVLLLPHGLGVIDGIPLNQTVLTCGSNAFRPLCQYRRRSNLQVISSLSGNNFCSVDLNTKTTSLWTSNNRLISALRSPTTNKFGIRVSESPYNGRVAVATSTNDNFWINNYPNVVSMYEIGDHIYIFFSEEAVEVTGSDKIIYSRVARFCKNDIGSNNPILSANDNVFLTFIKARLSCTSSKSTSDIPFHYNNIQDTFYLESGSYDGTTDARHLYAVFTSADNGPVGSAVCVYTFYSEPNDLGNVFQGNYLRRTSDGRVMVQSNFEEFSCAPGSRSVEEARDILLMDEAARQSNGPHPLLNLEGYVFRKIVVDQVTDTNGTRHEVMFIAAYKEGQLYLIKGVYSSTESNLERTWHLISTTPLNTDVEVTQMTLHGSGPTAYIYIGTENGIYRIPTADCGRLTDCCSCVSARDPYCAFHLKSFECVSTGSTNLNQAELLQDYTEGDINVCAAMNREISSSSSDEGCSTSVTKAAASETTSEREPNGVSTASSSTGAIGTPVVGGVNPGNTDGKDDEHTWTIVGVICGFIVGVVIGIILMAFFYQRGNIFARKDGRRPRRRQSQLYNYDSGESGSCRKDNTQKDPPCSKRRKSSGTVGGADYYKKEEDYLKNNHEMNSSGVFPTKGNDYTNMVTIANGGAGKFVLNPVPTKKGAGATAAPKVNGGANFAKNSVDGKPIAVSSVGGGAADPPTVQQKTRSAVALHSTTLYSRGTMSPNHSDLNLKSNAKLEESLTNHDRETYGRNILVRQPSVDTTSKLANATSGRTKVHPVLHVSYDRHRDFVSLADVPRTCSQC